MTAARISRQDYRALRDGFRKPRLDFTAHRAGFTLPWRQHLISERHAKYMADYVSWVNPHPSAIVVLFALMLVTTGFQMVGRLFMRYVADDVLLSDSLAPDARFCR